MTIESHHFPAEAREAKLYSLAPWLAGMFESAGLMRFEISPPRKTGARFAYPLIQLGDTQERLTRLQNTVGGNISHRPGGKTWHWRVRSTAAVDLAEAMLPFARSRIPIIKTFMEWEDADVEERVEIAQTFNREHHRTADFTHTDPRSYAPLVRNGTFLAGVIDGSGRFSPGTDTNANLGTDWIHHDLVVISKNAGLLGVLCRLYGGSIWTRYKPGVRRLPSGREIQIRESSVRWTIGPRAKKWPELMELVDGKLILVATKP